MTDLKAVKVSEPDPKTGKSRAKSGVSFPYYDLEQSIEVAETMHRKAGGTCDLAQLAALLGYKGVKNGSFLTRVAAAKMFGLIEKIDQKNLRVTDRSKAIISEISPQLSGSAKVDAFLNVELFKKVYDLFHGTTIPELPGLKNLLEDTYGVVEARVGPTVRIMLESAEQAGFFKATGDRTSMVKPVHLPGTPPAHSPPPPLTGKNAVGGGGGGGNGSGGGGGGPYLPDIDPAFLGLLSKLPPAGTVLSKQKREALISWFTATVGFIYPADEESE